MNGIRENVNSALMRPPLCARTASAVLADMVNRTSKHAQRLTQKTLMIAPVSKWPHERDINLMTLSTFVPGRPAPQGSKRYVGNGISIESSKAVKPWRADIREHVTANFTGPPLTGPVTVVLTFVMPRPVGAPKLSTPAAVKRPDIDKLTRAVLDALSSAGMWRDDSQVVELVARKRLAERDETPGCHIRVTGHRGAGA